MTRNLMKVGEDIKYHCSRCDLDLGHRILAMIGSVPARVRCNTCFSERNYRSPQKRTLVSSPREKERASSKSFRDPDFYRQKLQASLMKTPKSYRVDVEVEEGDVIDHKIFGRGVVLKTISPDRMEIIFQDEVKVLVCKVVTKAMA